MCLMVPESIHKKYRHAKLFGLSIALLSHFSSALSGVLK